MHKTFEMQCKLYTLYPLFQVIFEFEMDIFEVTVERSAEKLVFLQIIYI